MKAPILLLAAAVAMAPVGARAADLPTCTDNGRACLIASAMTYVEGLWHANPSGVRLAPTARRTRNGAGAIDDGAAVIRKGVASERLKNYRNLRLMVDEAKGDVFAFWMTESAAANAAHVAERIRVKNGLITEIEVFYPLDPRPVDQVKPVWPDEDMKSAITPKTADIGPCSGARRACLISVANTYLDGLMKSDGSKAKFAPNVRRTENGGHIQEGEAALRESLGHERLPFQRNLRTFVDEPAGTVIALWVTGTDTPANKSTGHVIERVTVAHGLITEIEVFYTLDPGTLDGASGWNDEP